MSSSYSENDFAGQNSVSDSHLHSAVKYIPVCGTKPKDLLQLPLNKGPSGNRRELKNTPQNIPLIILEN